MTKYTKNGFLFPSRNLLNINREGENGGTHYTIFGYRHRCAKIVSEPKGVKPPLDSPDWSVGCLGLIVLIETEKGDMKNLPITIFLIKHQTNKKSYWEKKYASCYRPYC